MHTQGITENFRISYERLVYLHQAKRPRLSVDFLMSPLFLAFAAFAAKTSIIALLLIPSQAKGFILFFASVAAFLQRRHQLLHYF
jgi:hypothetical protein